MTDKKIARPLLTVLTDPVPFGIDMPIEIFRALVRRLKRLINPIPHYMVSSYRGHPAVTRSLVEGLIKNNVNANYNPKSYKEIGETVIVLSGVNALRQAVGLKRQGYIKNLLAGPNILEFPSDYNGLITLKEVDTCVTPCEWTNSLYEDIAPSLIGRCVAWPAGVDSDFWKPNERAKRDTILIYEKQRKGPVGPIKPYEEWISQKGYNVKIIQCGQYTLSEFLEELQRAHLMVGFVLDESQGLAWAESWAVDVPTFIWRNTSTTMRGRTYASSTAPYLNPENGVFFDDFETFKSVFEMWEASSCKFSPRQWVLNNMTDEVCAKELCRIAGLI